MNYQIKREQLAKKFREDHRRSIIAANRKKIQSSQLYSISKFKYLQSILSYQSISLSSIEPSNKHKQQLMQFGVMVLGPLPPYIGTLEENNKDSISEENNIIINKLLEIFLDFMSLSICLKQVSQCLVQVSSLKIFSKQANLSILQPILITSLSLLNSQYSNTEICVNCVYILGNCYQQILNIRNNQQLNTLIDNAEYVVVEYFKKLLATYPYYHDCLLLLSWFLRNCLLITVGRHRMVSDSTMEIQDLKSNSCSRILKLSGYLINTTKSVITTINNQLCQTTAAHQQYLLAALCEIIQLQSLLIAEAPILYNVQQNNEIFYQQVISSNPLWHIDEAINIILSNEKLHKNNAVMDQIGGLALNILYLTNKSLNKIGTNVICFWKGIKTIGSIEKLIMIAARGQIGGSSCLQVLNQSIESLYFKQKLRRQVLGTLMINIEKLFKDNRNFENRNRRIALINIAESLSSCISQSEIKSIVSQYILQIAYNPSWSPADRRPIEQQIQIYFSNFYIPLIFKIVDIILIDQDYENILTGLKVIYNSIENWQLDEQIIEMVIKNLGIDQRIVEVSGENCPENVFDMATIIIDTLHIE